MTSGQGHEGIEPELRRGPGSRLRLDHWLGRLPARLVWAAFMLVNGFVSIALLGGLAMVTHTPFVFPSLGPTAFLCFFSPTAPAASPRNTLLGHAIGIVCGYAALLVTGLSHAGPAMVEGVDLARVFAAALSLGCTGALMILLRAPHPPAGATTLIISLGILTRPLDLLVIEAAVLLLVLQAQGIHRVAGVDYPSWASKGPPAA